MMSSRNSYRW